MSFLKKIWKCTFSRVWLLVTCILMVLAVAVNVLTSTFLYTVICSVLGRQRYTYIEDAGLYEASFSSKTEATANGNAVTYETCLEGFTLLKNNGGVLPLSDSETKVSVFGKNSVDLVYGGSGSSGGDTEDAKTLEEALNAAGIEVNPTLWNFYESSASGEGRTENPSDLDGGGVIPMSNMSTGETPQSSYPDEVKESYSEYADAALIVLSRIGGEGFDLPREEEDGVANHYLQLDENEEDLIEAVEEDFDKVIVLINTATTMELGDLQDDDGVDAIMWIGMPGNYGIMALGDLLVGETSSEGEAVSPSGHTVDIWSRNFQDDPTWENFGGGINSDAYMEDDTDQLFYFVDYEEGIYVGYRYYETAYAETEAGNYSGFDYDNAVLYPFGYGLSYATFEWTIENEKELDSLTVEEDTEMTVTVNVKNTSDTYSGRDVVQLYVTPPYTEGGIEKSAKVLVGFAKTDILAPGEDQDVEITVSSPYSYASYDCFDANGNGFAGYEIEAGEYIFSVSSDSHDVHDGDGMTFTKQLGACQYEEDPVNPTGTVVENQFEDADDELGSVLSRSDFVGTWPARRTDEERTKESGWCRSINRDYTVNNPNEYTEMPTTGADNDLSFQELGGADYDDERWDEFLDQLTFDEMLALFNDGAFQTSAISRLDVPGTVASDGTTGYVVFMGDPTVYGTCLYCCEMITASTWNTDRAYNIGVAEGEEGLIGNEQGDGTYYTGLYAPGMNLHRSPFGGRNFEYYSEDAVLTGKMAAAQINGAATKGVYYDMKHFALNDQETHRSIYGVTTWATEQDIREVYLKAFEIAIKEAVTEDEDGTVTRNAKGIMSSFNRIGTVWTGGDYRLLTTVLREEWGFRGLVICDFNTNTYMNCAQMAYGGGDLNLQTTRPWTADETAANTTVLRNAAKNILYVVANSNAVRGSFTVSMPTWQMCMFIVDGILAVGLIVWGVFAVRKAMRQTGSSASGDMKKKKDRE